MKKRLKQFIAAVKITQAQLAETLGVARGSISHLIQGRNKPGFDFLTSMMEKFPDLNIEWLMRGTGTMFKSLSPVAAQAQKQSIRESEAIETSEPSELDLFSSFLPEEPEQSVISPQELQIPVQRQEARPNIQFSERKEAQPAIVQSAVKQKHITKIVIFFDDNSFQELNVK